ncbi:MAG: Serine-tRNA ligase [Candidatus Woesebacteria bacterium GW2011_GWB1_43_14]|uniref:Serine--tRNA ligase n=1 Tax=Candidatus Woesebacteria bacterium GW2011_GWB1_43_14 TaxID=1618578 RepID=A0A0G1DIB3_9BACT|nr:MAG: Serine-tRNA ligase [Candidatus Woesebacteria bacterium GW2011_GWA1_39_11b]KKS77504.1 MAG: seryl-tRNA synthetase, seryl-tRNA synthetase [Candidatus Woesebacteria bacterium GW2011_GWC1_42_9]KKS97317.1 MAG: Serine-tRNA ligase [Candidatus Woesebacteria bacterium GW2011_GWB1_43_14]
MVNINDLREHPEKYKKATADKQFDPKSVEIALEIDVTRRALINEVELLRASANKAAKEKDIKKGKDLKNKLKKLGPELSELEKKFANALLQIPNPALNDVKVGKNESGNEIVRKWGNPREFKFSSRNHWELGEELGIIDTKRGAKVSGARFFYLKGDGVLLERSLTQFAWEIIEKEGFLPIVPPVLITRKSMSGMGYLEHNGEEDMYVLDKDDLVLVGTSEQSIGPMHAGETFPLKELPVRYMGISTCFRREAGSYGKDTKGAFRVHQFNKVEMFSFVHPEDGDREHEFMLSIEEKLLQKLGIPYQVSKMCSGDLGASAARKYDLEGWFPGEKKYRELTSTSTTTDFQSRRLNIKFQEKGKTNYVHMLNGTAFSQRPILAILENFQNKDGSVDVPEVLQKWMGKGKIKRD